MTTRNTGNSPVTEPRGREFVYCRGELRAAIPVGDGWYRCTCCGRRMQLVDTQTSTRLFQVVGA